MKKNRIDRFGESQELNISDGGDLTSIGFDSTELTKK